MIQVATVQQTVQPAPVSPDQSKAWLGLAASKNEMAARLETAELAAQSILLPAVGSSDYKVIDEALANYRKHHTGMVELRKGFTNIIDSAIIQPLMSFEKRVDPKSNEQYAGLAASSLSLRKTEEAKAEAINAKNQECN